MKHTIFLVVCFLTIRFDFFHLSFYDTVVVTPISIYCQIPALIVMLLLVLFPIAEVLFLFSPFQFLSINNGKEGNNCFTLINANSLCHYLRFDNAASTNNRTWLKWQKCLSRIVKGVRFYCAVIQCIQSCEFRNWHSYLHFFLIFCTSQYFYSYNRNCFAERQLQQYIIMKIMLEMLEMMSLNVMNMCT